MRANHYEPNGAVILMFRRLMRPAILALLRALPSPEKCGCQARKEWMIRQIRPEPSKV